MAAGVMGSAASLGVGRTCAVKPSVCRCLFDRSSAEELAETTSEFRRQQALVLDQKSRQYNFDFRSHKPLPGNYRWRQLRDDWVGEEAASVDVTPPSTPTIDAAIQTDNRLVAEVSGDVATISDAGQTTVVLPRPERCPVAVPSPSRKRKTITDYFPCKKLRSSTPPPPSMKDQD